MAGYNLRTIQELERWKELKMVECYTHLSPSYKAKVAEKILGNFTTLFTTSKILDSELSLQPIEKTQRGPLAQLVEQLTLNQ